jgi:hypothetical protein
VVRLSCRLHAKLGWLWAWGAGGETWPLENAIKLPVNKYAEHENMQK